MCSKKRVRGSCPDRTTVIEVMTAAAPFSESVTGVRGWFACRYPEYLRCLRLPPTTPGVTRVLATRHRARSCSRHRCRFVTRASRPRFLRWLLLRPRDCDEGGWPPTECCIGEFCRHPAS